MSGLLVTGRIAVAEPVEDFFKRLGRSISNAGKPQPARRTVKRKRAKSANARPEVSPTAGNETAASPPSATLAIPVRVASAAPPAKGAKRDVPYAIPVPGKQGFVTSPFAPDAGFVDVRNFPPGTEVKDPFTGKIFLTP